MVERGFQRGIAHRGDKVVDHQQSRCHVIQATQRLVTRHSNRDRNSESSAAWNTAGSTGER